MWTKGKKGEKDLSLRRTEGGKRGRIRVRGKKGKGEGGKRKKGNRRRTGGYGGGGGLGVWGFFLLPLRGGGEGEKREQLRPPGREKKKVSGFSYKKGGKGRNDSSPASGEPEEKKTRGSDASTSPH